MFKDRTAQHDVSLESKKQWRSNSNVLQPVRQRCCRAYAALPASGDVRQVCNGPSWEISWLLQAPLPVLMTRAEAYAASQVQQLAC